MIFLTRQNAFLTKKIKKMTKITPSRDPASSGTLTGLLKHVFLKNFSRIDTILPAVVVSFEAGNPSYVQVQPAIDYILTNNETKSRAPLVRVPVARIGSSAIALDFKIEPGDVGLLLACDRDISNFLKNGKQSTPANFVIKNFSNSFFLPIALLGVDFSGEGAVLQTPGAETGIMLSSSEVLIKTSDTTVTLTQGSINISSSGEIKITTSDRVLVEGDLAVSQNITAGGSITPNTPP